jgi:adenosylhomocysteinase
VRTQAVGCHVRDLGLADDGEDLIDRAARQMAVLLMVRERFEHERPLEGLRVSACLPVTAEAASLVIALKEGGADVALCASDPPSTDDAVAAALANRFGVRTYAMRAEDEDAHCSHLATVLAHRPDFTIDGGAELVAELHRQGGRLVDRVLGGTEGTARGVIRLRALAVRGLLRYPVIAVEEAPVDESFATQALALEYLAAGRARLERRVHDLPAEVDREVARLKLSAMRNGT